MRIVEKVREGAVRSRDEGETRIMRVDELERIKTQLRRATERNMKAFDEGFGACVQMVERGADLQQLRSACGVVATEWLDTEPVATIPEAEVSWEDEVTIVDKVPAFIM